MSNWQSFKKKHVLLMNAAFTVAIPAAVWLINRRMLAITNWLQKGGIQSLAEMQSALQAPPASVCCLDPHL